jgi:hypothetical protein
MEYDAEDEQAGEKKIPSPESILETLMVGCFVMGGSERLAEIQMDFKTEFGTIEEWIPLNLKYQNNHMDIYTINEEKESIIDDSRKSFNDDVRTSMQSNHDVKNNNSSFSQQGIGYNSSRVDHNKQSEESNVNIDSIMSASKSKSKKDRVVTEISNATTNFNETHKKMFNFHPGTFDFGKKGFWSEGWKCCGRAWRDEGCKKTKIDPNSALKLLIC